MALISEQALIDKIGLADLVALTDIDDPPTGMPNAARVAKAIADASALAESYLSQRYATPLAQVPEALAAAVTDMTIYRLYRDAAPELVSERNTAAVRWLERVAAGAVQLPLTSGEAAPRTTSLVEVESGGRVFARDTQW